MFSSSDIQFETNDETHALHVSITTERLCLNSVTMKSVNDYCNIFCDFDTMEKYLFDGSVEDDDQVRFKVAGWTMRWEQNNPFSAFAVSKKDDGSFIGNVTLGYFKPGISELAYAFVKERWRMGYGKEAVSAIVKEYAPELVKREYRLEGLPFSKIRAEVRSDNIASQKILESVGMKCKRKAYQTRFYSVATSELCHNESAITTGETNITDLSSDDRIPRMR